jgi:hypothetical protein
MVHCQTFLQTGMLYFKIDNFSYEILIRQGSLQGKDILENLS